MPLPQFLVMMYFILYFALAFIVLGLVGLGRLDPRGKTFDTKRDFIERWLVRCTGCAILGLLIYLGGFWG